MKILSVLMFALPALAGNSTAQITQPNESSYTINIAALPSVVKAGSEVKLSIIVKNISDQIIYHVVTTGKPGRNLDIAIRDSKGDPVQETPHGRKVHGTDPNRQPWSGSVFTGRYPLKPGETFKETINLSQEYDLSQPGTYSVQVLRSDLITERDIKAKSNAVAAVKSSTITLTVTP